ncbi:hypothetical protein AB4Y77_01225 [Paenarthrobacter sp. YAF11_1]|uniref:hypothetical protein n=1 Tax=Paenarthrobacter sp. YAF11_1 TaxID=3233074 RepID=UPI003F98B88B
MTNFGTRLRAAWALLIAGGLLFAGISPAVAAPDISAPVVVSHAVSATTLDVTSAPAKLSFSVRLTDETAVNSIHARFIHSSSGQYYYFPYPSLSSGTAQNGVWRSYITVPQGVANGEWSIQIYAIEDPWKNSTMGFINLRTINVISGSTDVAAPVIVSNAVSATTLDVTNAPAKLSFSVRITDETAVQSLHARFLHPATGQYYYFPYPSLSSGTAQNGIWRSYITLPQGVANGQWVIQVYAVEDPLKNSTFGFIELRTINVITGATTDVAAPAIVSNAVSSTALDVTGAPAKLSFSVRLTDETAVQGLHARFLHPETGQYYYFPYPSLATGTNQNGVWRSYITVPQGVANGDWVIQIYAVEDVVKNSTMGFINLRTVNVKSG